MEAVPSIPQESAARPARTALMAAALGGLLLAATVARADEAKPATNADGGAATGRCYGINSCKGTSACDTPTNSCAGMNSCKGQGWLQATKAECEAKGGKFQE